MLSPYRVLDLSDERGHLCGYALGALGAEVIAIEPPAGTRARHIGPFVDDIEGPERSLTHFAYNRGKKSVVVDIEEVAGRERLRGLVAGADVLIESETPGRMADLGLGYDELARINPTLVYTSISAFGQTGPKARWAATDLTVMASSVTLSLTGDADRPPVRLVTPQGFHFGAVSGACGTIMALIERNRSGVGQHVDAAAQRTAMLANQASVLSTGIGAPDPTRSAGGAVVGDVRLRLVYPAADGYVSITHVFGMPIGQNTQRLMNWVYEEGFCDEVMRDKDWVGYLLVLESGEEPIEEWERAKAAVAALTSSKTKAELLAGAVERGLLMAPISTPTEVLASEHFAERGFFERVEHPASGRTVMVPGAFAKCSATPMAPLGVAPRLGEHTDEILAEPPRRPAVAPSGSHRPSRSSAGLPLSGLPLSGLRVLDLTWSIAGPHAVRLLADAGATVVKVESANRQDPARGYRPVADNEAGIENSGLFDNMAAGKQSLALDMTKPQAVDVVKDLVGWADVVVDSFSPKAMPNWGLDYENLRAIKPDVIMVSTCLAGQYGPLANFAGYGNLGAAFAGFYGLAGWPDRPPAGPFGAYTDYTSTHFLAATLLAAIDHRDRTGEGQYIDLAQAEAAQHFLTPALLDAGINAREMHRDGNRDPNMAPHGVYPVAGDDRWIAIACQGDRQWSALAQLMARPDLVGDEGLASVSNRLARADELDAVVRSWTATREGVALGELLQTNGIAAHPVATGADALADPQLVDHPSNGVSDAHDGHFVRPAHPHRASIVENTRFRLSRTPTGPRSRAPFIGEHSFDILTEVLGHPADRVADLAANELFE